MKKTQLIQAGSPRKMDTICVFMVLQFAVTLAEGGEPTAFYKPIDSNGQEIPVQNVSVCFGETLTRQPQPITCHDAHIALVGFRFADFWPAEPINPPTALCPKYTDPSNSSGHAKNLPGCWQDTTPTKDLYEREISCSYKASCSVITGEAPLDLAGGCANISSQGTTRTVVVSRLAELHYMCITDVGQVNMTEKSSKTGAAFFLTSSQKMDSANMGMNTSCFLKASTGSTIEIRAVDFRLCINTSADCGQTLYVTERDNLTVVFHTTPNNDSGWLGFKSFYNSSTFEVTLKFASEGWHEFFVWLYVRPSAGNVTVSCAEPQFFNVSFPTPSGTVSSLSTGHTTQTTNGTIVTTQDAKSTASSVSTTHTPSTSTTTTVDTSAPGRSPTAPTAAVDMSVSNIETSVSTVKTSVVTIATSTVETSYIPRPNLASPPIATTTPPTSSNSSDYNTNADQTSSPSRAVEGGPVLNAQGSTEKLTDDTSRQLLLYQKMGVPGLYAIVLVSVIALIFSCYKWRIKTRRYLLNQAKANKKRDLQRLVENQRAPTTNRNCDVSRPAPQITSTANNHKSQNTSAPDIGPQKPSTTNNAKPRNNGVSSEAEGPLKTSTVNNQYMPFPATNNLNPSRPVSNHYAYPPIKNPVYDYPSMPDSHTSSNSADGDCRPRPYTRQLVNQGKMWATQDRLYQRGDFGEMASGRNYVSPRWEDFDGF